MDSPMGSKRKPYNDTAGYIASRRNIDKASPKGGIDMSAQEKEVSTELTTLSESLQAVRPDCAAFGLSADRVIRMVLSSVQKNKALLKCSTVSVVNAVRQAAQFGLEPGSPLGHAHLVPYRNKQGGSDCQLIPGYQGLIRIATRDARISHIDSRLVYKNDRFSVSFGSSPEIIHQPATFDRGEVVAAYAIAFFANGRKQFDVMNIDEINRIKERTKSRDWSSKNKDIIGPWKDDEDEMRRKTSVRRLCKYLPTMSNDLAVAIDLDLKAEGEDLTTIEAFKEPKTIAEHSKDQAAEASPEVSDYDLFAGICGSILPLQGPKKFSSVLGRNGVEALEQVKREQYKSFINEFLDGLKVSDINEIVAKHKAAFVKLGI